MSDIIRAGAAYLASALKKSAGTAVVVTRGTSSASVIATIGKSVFESADQNGVIESWESRDFLVKATDLPFGEPRRGDKIVESASGVSSTYEVTSPRGVPLFHYADAFHQSVRIHTKRVD
jgi:hypothetical protein